MIGTFLDAVATDRSPAADIEVRLSSATLFDVLGNGRRRATLACLAAMRDEQVPVDVVVDQVAAEVYDREPDALDHDQRWSARATLVQTHLPALEDAGLVRVTDDHVTLTDDGDGVAVLLDVVADACNGDEP